MYKFYEHPHRDIDDMCGNKNIIVLRLFSVENSMKLRKIYFNGGINSIKYSVICKGNQKIFSALKMLGLFFLKKKIC